MLATSDWSRAIGFSDGGDEIRQALGFLLLFFGFSLDDFPCLLFGVS